VSGTDRSEGVVRGIYEAYRRGTVERLLNLLAPDVELRAYLAPGRTLRGREEVRDAIERARSTLFEPHVDRYDTLRCGCVVAHGSVRYEMPGGGFKQHTCVWLFEVDDGLVRTWLGFSDEGLARQAHDCLHQPLVRTAVTDDTGAPSDRREP
jgi:ketosteroid isomerase-like protein